MIAKMQAGLSKESSNRVVLNTVFRFFFLVCSNPHRFNNPVAKSAGTRASESTFAAADTVASPPPLPLALPKHAFFFHKIRN